LALLKISNSHKGKIISENSRKKMSIVKLGKKQSKEHIEKVKQAKQKLKQVNS
jgi:DNA-binding protein H-NS